jgi:hypothetical protein
MDPMTTYLARAVIQARLDAADAQRPGRKILAARRDERRRRRRAVVAAWTRHPPWRRTPVEMPPLVAAAAAPVLSPSVEVARLLDATAHRVAEGGTGCEAAVLRSMSEVAAPTAPGAAAALGDETGSEASRLRAFGVVHAHLLDVLGPPEHALLLDLVEGRRDGAAPDRRVA